MSTQICRLVVFGIVAAHALLPPGARATEWIALHLYQFVEHSDVIAIGTMIDAGTGIVRIDEILKGKTTRTIQLVETHDPFARTEDQKPFINGAREFLFLQRKAAGYAPLQILSGRWRIADQGAVETGGAVGRSGATVDVLRRKIQQLVRLQADAAGRRKAVDAYIAAIRTHDADVRLWAAHKSASGETRQSDRLLDELVRHWHTGGEMQGAAANLIIRWRARRFAPMLAARLREGDAGERVAAVRALGGTGERTYLELLRAVAVADPSQLVRMYAYEGIAHLLGPDALDDLRRGATDGNPRVRGAIAVHAFNLARQIDNDVVRSRLKMLIEQLRDDPDRHVSGNARHVLAMWNRP